ncbi:UDP-N-acetylmuramoyl-L-alanyl-D-glutamate--2,6-diaminopimelate ligase [Pontibacterium granulatum]|uniref:UDP-N-acetylmuramoyl-L-alanyl-D-glutamate--2, 6-diaminopimelate ligase n=1 Tax=Pontibacterium granulatum TaxID=2036029 RepID=UPI00249C0C7E|nr:UDP-N-acetylmuramoyl-L-alanyl-D-glutamate--2,6-diaminopimelate ligase [Pontibacterium granulatum]MDI3323640.1 UDP-N-acetylmuramoyl-L-alanyl-D-glutamate--2,6-diaminopimelate ligase [Pontibacterium granulatum]
MDTIRRTLGELLPELQSTSAGQVRVSGITQDSRLVKAGDLFCARAGGTHKGRDFIPDALAKGAAAVLVDSDEQYVQAGDVPVIAVDALAQRLSDIAGSFYGKPSAQLRMIGITGTNGKTSCSHFLAQALNHLGMRTAVIGTVGNGFPDALAGATHTTPDAVGLQALLADFVQQGADAVVMEVSSHALDQHRVAGVHFEVGAFTNLSRDHLDYHGTMAEYGTAKAKLFTELKPQHAVISVDDAFGQTLVEQLSGSVFSFGVERGDIQAGGVSLQKTGIDAQLITPWGDVALSTQVVGAFNVSNLLLTVGVLGAMGVNADQIEQELAALTPVPGRMQCLGEGDQPLVIVDYAHTPDALEKALEATREHTAGKLLCVFGCGGDRDNGKRPEMGRIAAKLADALYITSDNPRTEDPQQIIDMIVPGCAGAEEQRVHVDREQAIQAAVKAAGSNDVVLIAGKGHEDYQEIMGKRYPFDDVQVAQAALGEWSA